ncbi:hypothetical protein ACFQRB_06020 [Halobaculum litoreum]|uniref:Secreted protein n=1 Tax=Halobaculum litoreum TaxID=3031998 RepID=A0ABD5XR27_9EURY
MVSRENSVIAVCIAAAVVLLFVTAEVAPNRRGSAGRSSSASASSCRSRSTALWIGPRSESETTGRDATVVATRGRTTASGSA